MSDTTLVITSCGREDLLKKTVRSFFKFNTAPLDKTILIDDSGDPSIQRRIQKQFGGQFDHVILNEQNIGQVESIDRAYGLVNTPYIFHCEDDWRFTRKNFIEDSRNLLEGNSHTICVWLRASSDFDASRIGPKIHESEHDAVAYHNVIVNAVKDWHGFTFNPGLRRLSDYQAIAPFTDVGLEMDIGKKYRALGYHAVILDNPAVEHIGENRSVDNAHKNKRTWLQKRLGLNKQRQFKKTSN